MNVFVVVADQGQRTVAMKPFIAATMSDAVTLYELAGYELNDIVGVFVYGKHPLLLDAIKEVDQ